MSNLPTDEILEIIKRYGVENVRVFGSRARGDSQPGSDLDLLVDYGDHLSLFDVIRLEQELEDLLGFRVETVSEASLHRVIKDRVLAEAKPLVAA